MWPFKAKVKESAKIPDPDYVALIGDLAIRVSTLEKLVARHYMGKSPGNPHTAKENIIAENDSFKVFADGTYHSKR